MSLIRVLIVDDKFTHSIREKIERLMDLETEIDFKLISKFEKYKEVQNLKYEIAIFDYHNEAKNESPGHIYAELYAAAHPTSLVLMKSVHRLSELDHDHVRNDDDSYQRNNIRFAVDLLDHNITWDKRLLDHVAGWLRRGRTATSVKTMYQLVDARLASPNDAERMAAAAQYLFGTHWFDAAEDVDTRERQGHLLALLGANLKRMSHVVIPPPETKLYLRVLLDEHRTWVPWELLLFESRYPLQTPISYVVPTPSRKSHQPWNLKKVIYVSLSGLDTEAEQNSITSTLRWIDGFALEVVTYKDFVARPKSFDGDVVHLAMHGPNDPTEQPSLAKLSPLLSAIKHTRPSLLVLNTCHGISMLLDNGRTPYPFPVGHLENLLGDVDTIVTSQFPLENENTPRIWASAFYRALSLTGDAAIAAGWARAAVAQTLARFYELATVVVSRRGSPLALTEI